jgi:hypothetical protein
MAHARRPAPPLRRSLAESRSLRMAAPLLCARWQGFAELEYGIMRWMGAIDNSTLVVTTVHDCQVQKPAREGRRADGERRVPGTEP